VSQDFAKRKKKAGARKPAANTSSVQRDHGGKHSRDNGLRMYFAGVLTGVFFSFIGYLTTLSDPIAPGEDVEITPQVTAEVPKPRFDFYTLLPEQTLEVDVEEELEPAADIRKPPASTAQQQPFLLQAGSFRQREDAERRRAELLLLGLEPTIEESRSDTGRWFRVYLGPFESQKSMSRARGLTANQNIDTLVLKRGGG
jgi:cell division septation protein DedD